MGQEYGKCQICSKEAPLRRKYYHYNIECECCSSGGKPQHFEIVWYCKDCQPKPPRKVTIHLSDKYLEVEDEKSI